MFSERVPGKAEFLSLLLFTVDRAEEGAALDREHGLRGLSVAKLAAAVSVAAGFDHVARSEDAVESVLGIGGERAAERLELGATTSPLLSGS